MKPPWILAISNRFRNHFVFPAIWKPDLPDPMQYWQNRILHILLVALVVAGFIVLVPSVWLSIKETRYYIAIFDVSVYGFVFYVFFRKTMPYLERATGVSVITYLLGIILLSVLGPFGAGPVWLFAFPIITAVLLGNKAAVVALCINIVTLAGIGLALNFEVIASWDTITVNPVAKWVVVSINFMFLNLLATLSLTVILKGLQSTLAYERKLKAALKIKQEQLESANTVLQVEIDQKKAAITKLNESEENYRITLDSIGDAVVATDKKGCITHMNPVAQALTGWSKEEGLGKVLEKVFQIINEESRQAVESPVLKVFREGKIVSLANHTLLISKAGKQIPVADSGAPIRNAKGQITGVVLVFRDQTEEREYQKKISDSEKKFKALYNSIRDAIMVADTNRTIIDCNPAFFDLFGYSPDEIIGQKTLVVYEKAEDFKQLGNVLTSQIGDSGISFTINYLKKNRGVFCGETSVFHLRDSDGHLIGFIGLIRDITTRLSAENALNESEQRFRLLVENAPDAIFVQTQGRFAYLNHAAAELFGVGNPSDLIGESVIERFHPDFRESVRERIRLLNETGTPVPRLLETCLRMDGTPVNADISAVPFEYGGDHGALVFLRDMTESLEAQRRQNELEAQLHHAQKIESMGRLAGGVAHDFNNMLSVMTGYTEMAMEKVGPQEPLYADLNEILIAAKRSANITRQLLAFARQQTIAPRLLDLNDTVESMLKMLRRLIGENIDLVWHPKVGLWPVKMDPTQIDQILANLSVNARDAIADVGKLTIETDMLTFDEAYCAEHTGFVIGDFVLLAISDDGCGMDHQTLEKIFEPFFTTKGLGQGTGLGLSTVYGIVKQNDGFINVYSEPGKGTTFEIYLPRPAGLAIKDQTENVVDIPKSRGEVVLVVEDEILILNLAEKMLTSLDYRVILAQKPAEALQLAQMHTAEISLLITDVVMPEMNGRELAERLQALYPQLKCLFMSGYTADVIAHRGILEEGVHFIQKPFSKKDLAIKVRSTLDEP